VNELDQLDRDAQPADYRTREASIDISSLPSTDTELLTLNMGPHHPATHGVLRLLVTLEGEVVRDLKPIIGYVHTGIEKTAEDKSYWKVIPVVERMDYLAYYFNAQAFCGAVETLLQCEVPKRAQYLRVLHLELNRIMSHLVWLGTSALDLGAISMFWYCFRDRETILDLFEYSSGQRMHTRYIQVGGVIEDIPVGFAEKVRAFCREMPERVDQYEALLAKNEIVMNRLRGVCAGRGDAAAPRRHRPAAARDRQPVGPAQGDAVLVLRRLRVQHPGRLRGRQLRPLLRADR
jgi:NADH-quinone oxidoreductase subunit D